MQVVLNIFVGVDVLQCLGVLALQALEELHGGILFLSWTQVPGVRRSRDDGEREDEYRCSGQHVFPMTGMVGFSDAGARRDLLICGRSLRPRGCASLEKERQGGQLARTGEPPEACNRRVDEQTATDRGGV